jgi:hypothetical protein
LGRGFGLGLLALAILGIGTWCGVGLWYQLKPPEPFRLIPPVLTAVLTLTAVFSLATRKRWIGTSAFLGAFVAFLIWWATIAPKTDSDWTAEVARMPTAVLSSDKAVVSNVRNFAWRSETDFDPVWETRTYDLSTIIDVDLIMSYWMGEAIAHTIISFGFADGQRLAFSIETRKERHESFSSVAGFFKQFELAIVAADERDVIRVRSNVRGEDVRLYRLRMTPENARLLFREYLEQANDLARAPRFYNTATSNCTTLVFDMVRVIHPGLPLDYRVILAGYLPDYAYAVGALDTDLPFARLRELAKIHDNAIRADKDPDFSAKIRERVPKPHQPR